MQFLFRFPIMPLNIGLSACGSWVPFTDSPVCNFLAAGLSFDISQTSRWASPRSLRVRPAFSQRSTLRTWFNACSSCFAAWSRWFHHSIEHSTREGSCSLPPRTKLIWRGQYTFSHILEAVRAKTQLRLASQLRPAPSNLWYTSFAPSQFIPTCMPFALVPNSHWLLHLLWSASGCVHPSVCLWLCGTDLFAGSSSLPEYSAATWDSVFQSTSFWSPRCWSSPIFHAPSRTPWIYWTWFLK